VRLVLLLAFALTAAAGPGRVVQPARVAAWQGYLAGFPSAAAAPALKPFALTAPGQPQAFLGVVARTDLTPAAVAAAPDDAARADLVRTAVASYVSGLLHDARVGGASPETLAGLSDEFEQLAAAPGLVGEYQREAVHAAHEKVASRLSAARAEGAAALAARVAAVRKAWGSAAPEDVPAPAAAAFSGRPKPKDAAWRLKPAPAGPDRASLENVTRAEHFLPESVFSVLKRDAFLREQYVNGSSGFWSLEEHSAAVVEQFERFFRGPVPGGLERSLMRLILALHDIGKPSAARGKGVRFQHEYNRRIVTEYMGKWGYTEREAAVAAALVGSDPIGGYLKEGGRAPGAEARFVAEIRAGAEEAGIPVADYYDLLRVYYMSDASAYTLTGAGGEGFLDHLFVFKPAEKRMELSPRTAAEVERLRRLALAPK
jgi:hypothetical protein